MINFPERFPELLSLMDQFSMPVDMNEPPKDVDVDSFKWGAMKISKPFGPVPFVDSPAIWVVGQGTKYSYSGGKRYDLTPGKVVIMFYPMAVETEIVDVTPENPLLVTGAFLNMQRMLDVLQRIERVTGSSQRAASSDPSGILEIDLTDDLVDSFIRLFRTLANPIDAALLTDGIMDEIYYRLLTGENGAELRYLLRQRGEIVRISRAVDYIHHHLEESVSVEKLADLVHMSQASFYENFRSVMHTSPLKYAKSIKLSHAQQLIRQGKKANEASYLVGYNSPAQFSREYKRHFGYAPSMTV